MHLGQLVDTSRDAGLDSLEESTTAAYEINGSMFNGEVTQNILTVEYVLPPISTKTAIPYGVSA